MRLLSDSYLTRLQGSLTAGPDFGELSRAADLLPSDRPYDPSRTFDAPLLRLTPAWRSISFHPVRIVLVTFALWILVVEPTFRAFEQIDEQRSSHEEHGSGETCLDADQPVPPSEVLSPRWVNDHSELSALVSSLYPSGPRLLLSQVARDPSPVPLPPELCLPYPPSAQPLRL